ncbi:hypothetical protein DL764_010593 [Monosporascus ibericus]|uniref:Protein kinase domain-containing protein n=1 Tax=Monosporascus ibericus TaxID=155417 RepID=A0A4Q4SV14_9PEZI|nr:hypothetical protein DL764_010593 [Monosporascus ibericus]
MGNSQGKPVELTGEVNLNHFRLLRVVGRGAFGKVRIVERKDTGLSFALKYIRKDEVDIEYMYLVVDLMSGGDLRFHISRKTFTEEAVRFWIAELGCALRYVHGQGIIHRDVKPDNVLLDADGHVHLTDFNVASDVIPGKALTSKSGTLAYLAPEVYGGKGYDVRADWWSLGVLFYECIYNKRPFEGNSETTLTNVILNASPKFPVTAPPVSLPCLYAMGHALEANPDKRLGSTWDSFINEPFFQAIDFVALERKEIEPVFVPSSDKTNFDATYDLEELLLEEAPLEARARRQKPREKLKDDATQKEIREEELYRTIERDFRPFDYTLAAITAMQGEGSENAEASKEPQALTTDGATAAPATNGTTQPVQQTPPVPGAVQQEPTRPPPLRPYPDSYTNKVTRPSGVKNSPGGGLSVTIDATGSWSQLARQDATLPADASAVPDDKSGGSSSSGGVFGLFGRKKGRGHSPKPKERGILGKEGARQIIG